MGYNSRAKSDRNQVVGAVLISNHAPVQKQQQGNQRRPDAPRRQFTKINMPFSGITALTKSRVDNIEEPLQNPNYVEA